MSHFIYFFAECHYAECHCAACSYAKCRYAECRYAECCGAHCGAIKASFDVNWGKEEKYYNEHHLERL